MRYHKFCAHCKSLLRWGMVEGRRRLHCKKCGWINYHNPVPVVACLVRNKKGEILLIRRNVAPCIGRWSLPGGFMELRETAQQAARRELKEETGLSGKAIEIVDVLLQESSMYGSVLVVGVELEVKDHRLKVGDDASDAKFFPHDKLPRIPFKNYRKLVRGYLRSRPS